MFIRNFILGFLLIFYTHVVGNYKCRFSVNKNASFSAFLISDFTKEQKNKERYDLKMVFLLSSRNDFPESLTISHL